MMKQVKVFNCLFTLFCSKQVDHWLRKRNGDWELKYPVGTTEHRGNTSIYHETTDLEDVLQLLKPILNSGGINVF